MTDIFTLRIKSDALHLLVSTQTVVGCPQDALRATRDELQFLAEGLFKQVYLNDDSTVVYKRVHPPGAQAQSVPDWLAALRVQLQAECAEAIRLQADDIPGIPNVTLYDVGGEEVLAMPFMPLSGRDAEMHPSFQVMLAAWERCGLRDLYYANYAADASGFPYVIDLAGWAEAYVLAAAVTVPAPVLHPLVVRVCGEVPNAA